MDRLLEFVEEVRRNPRFRTLPTWAWTVRNVVELLANYPDGVSAPIISSEVECRLRKTVGPGNEVVPPGDTGGGGGGGAGFVGIAFAFDSSSASLVDTVVRTGRIGALDVLEVTIQSIWQLPNTTTKLARLWDGHSNNTIDMYLHSGWDRYEPGQFPFVPEVAAGCPTDLAAGVSLTESPWTWRFAGTGLSSGSGEPRLLPTLACAAVLDVALEAALSAPHAAARDAIPMAGHRAQQHLRYLVASGMLDESLSKMHGRMRPGSGALLVSLVGRVLSRTVAPGDAAPSTGAWANRAPKEVVLQLRDVREDVVGRLCLWGPSLAALGLTFAKGDTLGLEHVEAEMEPDGTLMLFVLPETNLFVLPRSRGLQPDEHGKGVHSPAKPLPVSPLQAARVARAGLRAPRQGNTMKTSAVERHRDAYGVVNGNHVSDRLMIAGLAPRMKNFALAGYILSVSSNQPKQVAGNKVARTCIRLVDESETAVDITCWGRAAENCLRLRKGQMALLNGLQTSTRSSSGVVYVTCDPLNGGTVACLSTSSSWPASRSLCRTQPLAAVRAQRSAVVRGVVVAICGTGPHGAVTCSVHGPCLRAVADGGTTCHYCTGVAEPMVPCYSLAVTLDDGAGLLTADVSPAAAERALQLSVEDYVKCGEGRQRSLLDKLVGSELVCVVAAATRGTFRIDALSATSAVTETIGRLQGIAREPLSGTTLKGSGKRAAARTDRPHTPKIARTILTDSG